MSGALALFTAAATGTPALAGPTALTTFTTASAEFPVNVAITGLSTAGGTLTVSGDLTNTGSSAVEHPHVGLKLGNKQLLDTRSGIANVMGRGDPVDSDGSEVKATQTKLDPLPAAGSAPFRIQLAESDLKLGQSGVYELAVDVQDDNSNVLGIARTLLPYLPDAKDAPNPLKVSTVWPITHAPELVAQTSTDDQSPVLRDDSLVAELAPEGRLGKLVSIGAQLPSLTWAIDPDLLDTVLAMTKPYRVQLPGHAAETARTENTAAGQGKDVATKWLTALRQAVTSNNAEVVALPYADPDLASIAHNGSGLAGLDTAVAKARTAGRVTVEGRLSVDTVDNVAWPYQGYLDQQVAGTTQKIGASVVLVNGASLPDPTSLNHTPSAARPISGGQTAVVADSTVSGLFQSDLNTAQGQFQAHQRYLAETLEITLQQPNLPRTLLVLPPRELTVNTAQTLADSLQAADGGKWTTAATLATVAAAPADPKANSSVPSPASYPGELRRSELTGADFQTVSDMQVHVDQLLRILTDPQRVSSPFSAAMVRSVSTAWRDNHQAGADFRANTGKYLQQLTDAVAIPTKSQVITLAGDSGLLQVSVKNDLRQTVTNLQLRLTSKQPNRLKVGDRVSDSVRLADLPAGHSASVVFNARKAAGNGLVPMVAQLYTVGPDAAPYGPEVNFQVEVTNVPNGVWWVLSAGALLVVLAGGRIYLKRKKRTGDYEDPDAPLAQPGESDGADRPHGSTAQS